LDPIVEGSKNVLLAVKHRNPDRRCSVQVHFNDLNHSQADTALETQQVGMKKNGEACCVESPSYSVVGAKEISPALTNGAAEDGADNLRRCLQ
jgi:hypothetical protein